MLKKYISYTDYNGVARKEAFYFNLSKAELVKMQMSTEGGMEEYLQRIIDTHDNRKLFELFDQLIKMSYGIKSEDGRRFTKSEKITEEFCQTEAYTELLLELMGDDSAHAVLDFVKGIMPLDGISEEEIDAAVAQATAKVDAAAPDKVVPITGA